MADIDVNYDPITVNNGPVTVALTGLDDISIRYPEPIQTDSDVDAELRLRIPDPIQTNSTIRLDSASEIATKSDVNAKVRSDVNANVDLQPVVLDQCLRLSLAPLPPTRICLPSRQRVALSLFGVEIVGLTLEGEARVDVTDLPRASFVKLAKPEQSKGDGLRVRLGT